MRAILLLAFLAFASPASSGDFDYGAYETAQLAKVASDLEIDPLVNYWFDAAHPKCHTIATFTGNKRAIDDGVKSYIGKWVGTMGHPPEYVAMFQSEVEVRQGSETYWLPIQQQLVGPFDREVPAGAEVHLYVLLLGAYEHVPVFAISEFNVVGG